MNNNNDCYSITFKPSYITWQRNTNWLSQACLTWDESFQLHDDEIGSKQQIGSGSINSNFFEIGLSCTKWKRFIKAINNYTHILIMILLPCFNKETTIFFSYLSYIIIKINCFTFLAETGWPYLIVTKL